MYLPTIIEANICAQYAVGPHSATFYDQIRSEGSVRYAYMISVYRRGEVKPFFIVTSEENDVEGNEAFMAELLENDGDVDLDELGMAGGGSHFLCTFEGERHSNLGHSNDWADASMFESKALSIISDKLGHTPSLLSNG